MLEPEYEPTVPTRPRQTGLCQVRPTCSGPQGPSGGGGSFSWMRWRSRAALVSGGGWVWAHATAGRRAKNSAKRARGMGGILSVPSPSVKELHPATRGPRGGLYLHERDPVALHRRG